MWRMIHLCFFFNYSGIAFPLGEKLKKHYQFKTSSKQSLTAAGPLIVSFRLRLRVFVIE